MVYAASLRSVLKMGFNAIFSLKIPREECSLNVLEADDAITQAWQA